jgi:AcrR family transcriptional regulator
MAQKRKTDQTKLVAEAALSLADRDGWERLDMAAAARRAKVPQATAARLFPDKWALLKWIMDDVARETEKTARPNLSDSWRDNLFEIMMARLDIAQRHRGAFSSLPRLFPQAAPRLAPLFPKHMRGMLKLAGAPASPLHVAAFGVLYVSVVYAWMKDETHDLAKTMAALDKRLDTFRSVAECAAGPSRKGSA